ncbi:Protein UXT-like protein [Hordeum vulgare]|nr:Protein UXT-like protein [Hordeum vulgare]
MESARRRAGGTHKMQEARQPPPSGGKTNSKKEDANAKTKAKEVALASMKTDVKIMKVGLNTVSSRKRLWFQKMQTEMLKFDQL